MISYKQYHSRLVLVIDLAANFTRSLIEKPSQLLPKGEQLGEASNKN